jgi:hypothetical protein
VALNTKTLYPDYAVLQLGFQTGIRWQELVDQISSLPRTHPHAMAMLLTVKRLARTQARPQRGNHADPRCAICVSQLVAAYAHDEQLLLDLFERSLSEVETALGQMRRRKRARRVRAA